MSSLWAFNLIFVQNIHKIFILNKCLQLMLMIHGVTRKEKYVSPRLRVDMSQLCSKWERDWTCTDRWPLLSPLHVVVQLVSHAQVRQTLHLTVLLSTRHMTKC